MKKLIVFALLCVMAVVYGGCSGSGETQYDNTILCTVFPQYDIARRIAGDKIDTNMLVPAGSEAHDFEPTAKDIKSIGSAALFIYIGGESDSWVEKIINANDTVVNGLSLIDCVEKPVYIYEEGHAEEIDEHIWTSPRNMLLMAKKIKDAIVSYDPANTAFYNQNYDTLVAELTELDTKLRQLSEKLEGKTLIIGDRNPFVYLATDYGISIQAAYHGCGHDSEPSASQIASLIGLAREQNTKIVYYVDYSTGSIANTIAETVSGQTERLFSCHQVTSGQLSDGETYFTLVEKNIQSMLKAAQD